MAARLLCAVRRSCRRSFSSSAVAARHPLVDVGGLLASSGDARRRGLALGQLRAALLDGGPGYFYAANMDDVLSADYIRSVYAFARQLHSLPVDVKRSYVGIGGSSTAGAVYSGSDAGQEEPAYDPKTKAAVRSWDYSRLRRPPGGGAALVPKYPDVEPDFRATMDDLYERQNALGAALLTAFAEVLDLPADALSRHFVAGDMGTIRLLHYPGDGDPDAAEADVGIAPHTDFEAFTLMHQNAPGLQFLPARYEARARGGASPAELPWIDAPVRDAEFVVILGDVLERFTNGVLRATPHRVVRTGRPRLSIIRFNAVAPEVVVEPMAPFVTAAQPRAYTRCTMKQHMDTTIGNLEAGLGSWDATLGRSTSAHYRYEE